MWYIHTMESCSKSLQSCPTLCDPIDGSPPGSPVPGILQTRVLEWVAISFSNALKWKVKVKSLSRVWLLATPWTAAYQAPPSMGFSRQEYWSGVPSPSPIAFSSTANYNFEVFPLFNHTGFFLFGELWLMIKKNSIMLSKIPSSNFPRATSKPCPTIQNTQELCFKAAPHDSPVSPLCSPWLGITSLKNTMPCWMCIFH